MCVGSPSSGPTAPMMVVALRFARDPVGGQSDEYQALVGNKAKQEFRKKWAAERWSSVASSSAKRTQEDTSESKSGGKSKWYTEKHPTSAQNYMQSCVEKAGDWRVWNAMAHCYIYRYVENRPLSSRPNAGATAGNRSPLLTHMSIRRNLTQDCFAGGLVGSCQSYVILRF